MAVKPLCQFNPHPRPVFTSPHEIWRILTGFPLQHTTFKRRVITTQILKEINLDLLNHSSPQLNRLMQSLPQLAS